MLAGEVLTLLLVVGPEKSLGWWRNVRSPLTTAGSAIQPPAHLWGAGCPAVSLPSPHNHHMINTPISQIRK